MIKSFKSFLNINTETAQPRSTEDWNNAVHLSSYPMVCWVHKWFLAGPAQFGEQVDCITFVIIITKITTRRRKQVMARIRAYHSWVIATRAAKQPCFLHMSINIISCFLQILARREFGVWRLPKVQIAYCQIWAGPHPFTVCWIEIGFVE